MFLNYLKIAYRSLLKYKSYALINLVGLSLGLTAGVLIMIYVLDEASFDKFHVNKDRLYRVNTSFTTPESGNESANETNGWPIGKVLEKDFPEVEKVLYSRGASFLMINQGDKRIRQNIHFASPEFFSMFSFPLLKGNAEKALTEPYSIVISEAMEQKYFPQGDALNKTLIMVDTLNMVVTGVMANIPANSHIQADMLISFSTYSALDTQFSYEDGWGNINVRNYVLLKEGTDFNHFASKAKDIYMNRVGEMMKNWGVSAYVLFEPMPEIYLTTKSGNGMGPVGSIDRIYLVSGIAVFVILLACINFVNLATARSVYRAREVGLRKVVGSTRKGLIAQFLSESFVLTIISLFFALVLIGISLPFFNQVIGKNYQLLSLANLSIVSGTIMLVVVVSLLAGYYPALIMSSLKPVEVLKGKMQTSARGVMLRRSLVVFQFVISVALVTGTWIILDQLTYMQKQNLGFDKDEIFVINAARVNSANPQAFETFKDQLSSLATVNGVSYTNAVPGNPGWMGQVAYPEGKSGDDAVSVEYMAVDDNYLNVLGLELIAGRGFDKQRAADLENGLILNETAVSVFGWSSPEEAIGKKITSPSRSPQGEVIGVVKDYHQFGLQQKIGPMTMDYAPQYSYLYVIKYKAANTQELIASLNELWIKSFPGYDFNYFFLDQDFERQYQSEQRLANVFALFAGITMVIAIIGLLGLVSFMVVARTKEIGVRKVLGADVLNIAGLLSKEFVVLVLVANLIAFPLTWYFANEWLQTFAFRMSVNPLLFIGTMVLAILFTLLVVSFQTIKAALTDPVKALRYE
jgi:putative ABC transport system permease protein